MSNVCLVCVQVLLKDPRSKPIWQTTTERLSYDDGSTALRSGGHGTEAAVAAGWDVVDRRALTTKLYPKMWALPCKPDGSTQHSYAWSDNLHFQPYVYTEFNNVLLNKLCANAGVDLSDSDSEPGVDAPGEGH